jgi:hypothetical protein
VKRWIPAAGAVALAAIVLAVPVSAGWVDHVYSNGLYAWMQPRLTRVSNLAPFALDDVVLAFTAVALLAWLFRAVRSPRREGMAFILRAATLGALLLLASVITFGANFRRSPLRSHERFDAKRVTDEAVAALGVRAAEVINETFRELPAEWPDRREVHATLAPLFLEAAKPYTPWSPALGRPKTSLLDPWMRRVGMNGYFLPYFHEVALNSTLLPSEVPYVLAHEWGHGIGRANESEAAYFGWLACEKGPPWARYSAWMRVFDYVWAELPRDERRALYARLDEGPKQDMEARRQRMLKQFEPALRRVNSAVTDGAARVAGVGAEQRDYGLLLQLILGMPATH